MGNKKYEMIAELKNSMDDICIDMVDGYYDTTEYICDSITYCADDNIDLYNGDLINWLTEDTDNVYAMEEAINEGLVDCHNFDLYRAIQAGQYKQYSDTLYEGLDDMIELATLYKMPDDLTDEQIDDIVYSLDVNIDHNNSWDEIGDYISDTIEGMEVE